MSGYLIFSIYSVSLLCIAFDYTMMPEKAKRHIFDFICIFLVIVAASKTELTSNDTYNYVNAFYRMPTIHDLQALSNWYEFGYTWINVIVKSLGFDYHAMFLVVSLISISLYRKIILLYCKNRKFLALFVYVTCYYFLNEIIIIRFGIACALVFFNIKNMVERKKVMQWLTIALAALFHSIGWIGVIPIILYNSKKTRSRINTYIFLAIIVSLAVMIISPKRIIQILLTVPNFPIRIGKYMMAFDMASPAGLRRAILYLPTAILTYLTTIRTRNKSVSAVERKTREELSFVCFIYVLIAMGLIVGLSQNSSLSRLNSMMLTSIIVVHPLILDNQDSTVNKVVIFLYTIIMCSYIFFRQNFFNSGFSINIIW